jgi:hypothetical protein
MLTHGERQEVVVKVPRMVLGISVLMALAGSPAAGQMGGSGTGGPFDGMTNGSEDLIVPAGVRGDGKNGAFFVTDLWIKAAATGQVTLAFHAADAATSSPTATATVTLSRPVTYLPDVIQATFGLPAAFGNIRVTAGFGISATVRVYNRTGAGAYGLAFMGMPVRMSMTSMPMSGGFGMDDFAMYMLGLLPQPGNRVNVTVVNTSPGAVSGVVEILDGDGSAPAGSGANSYPFSLAGYSSHQLDDVLADLHSKVPSGDAGLQVRVRLSQGSPGMVMAYAVVNDNLTSDGYVVMGSMMNGGRGMGGGMTGGR